MRLDRYRPSAVALHPRAGTAVECRHADQRRPDADPDGDTAGHRARPATYESKAAWYDPAHSTANFVVPFRGIPGFPGLTDTAGVLSTIGRPARTYQAGPYQVLVWNRNLLTELR